VSRVAVLKILVAAQLQVVLVVDLNLILLLDKSFTISQGRAANEFV
jgi:hypothetical protein